MSLDNEFLQMLFINRQRFNRQRLKSIIY